MANYQLSKTGAEIDAALSMAVEHETSKADIDGSYDGLTAGKALIAEQIESTVYVEDKVPYNFRTAGGSANIGNRLTDKLVGGSIVWNQLVQNGTFATTDNWSPSNGTRTVSDNELTVTISSGNNYALAYQGITVTSGHKVLMMCDAKVGTATRAQLQFYANSSSMVETTSTSYERIGIIGIAGDEYTRIRLRTTGTDGQTAIFRNAVSYDITAMFGSAIADYIYSLETATAGAGVAWFTKLFPKVYYAYNAGAIMSVNVSAHNTIGFNAFNPTTGTAKLVGGNQYQITGTYTSVTFENGTTITPDSSGYFTPEQSGAISVAGSGDDTCVHLVWDGERDGEYEAYVKHEYSLDESLTLRGIPKLDANNELYYDGDTYASDGTVTRKFKIRQIGTVNGAWGTSDYGYAVYVNYTDAVNRSTAMCDRFVSTSGSWSTLPVGAMGTTSGSNTVFTFVLPSSVTSIAQANQWFVDNPTTLQYEVSPTTETADPFTNPQIVDDFGTEEYVDYAESQGTRDVAIPVGHETQYQNNLRAKLEMSPNSPDGNGDYIVRQTNGINEYVPLVIPDELPDAPTTDGTYRLTVTVANGTPTLSWVAVT